MSDSEWSRPAGLKLARENLQSRVKEEDSVTNVENVSEGQSLHASRPGRLCAQAQSVDDMPSRKQAYMEYTRWVFCKLYRRPRELHLACPTRRHGSRPLRERPHEIDAPNVENFTNMDGILRHFISLQNLSMTLTSVTRLDQVLGITVDCGPIESRVKHLFGGVVQAMMSPNGSIVASLENVNGFLAVNTPPDDLIRIDFE
nr:hypothetical protein [Tanacetum cinerariifolium]